MADWIYFSHSSSDVTNYYDGARIKKDGHLLTVWMKTHYSKHVKDDNLSFLIEKIMNSLFLDHPYSNPIIGYKDIIANFKSKDLKDFFKKFYKSENTIIVVSGDFQEIDPSAYRFVQVYKGGNGLQLGANSLGGAMPNPR